MAPHRDLHLLTCCAVIGALLAPMCARGQADSTWKGLRHAMLAALSAGDSDGYRTQLGRLQHQVGTTPRLATELALAAFRARDTASGMRWSRNLAAMGVPFDTSLVAPYVAPGQHAVLDSMLSSNLAAMSVIDRSRMVWRLADPDMIAEDVGYDAPRQRFLVSSVRRGAIYSVDRLGRVTSFISPGARGVWGILALGVDVAHGVLWATTAAFPGAARYTAADSARSALLEYDLVTGMLRRRLVPPDSGPHALGDLTVGPDGTVYVSDGFGGGVYALGPGAPAMHALVPAGTFSSPQTPALDVAHHRLFVPDYAFGIAAIDLVSGRWRWLQHQDSLPLTGIDGLYHVGRDLVAVQNGLTPNRIVRLGLDGQDRIVSTRVLVRAGEGIDLNHALWRAGQLYFIARSGWDRVAPDGAMTHGLAADRPAIRRVACRQRSAGSE